MTPQGTGTAWPTVALLSVLGAILGGIAGAFLGDPPTGQLWWIVPIGVLVGAAIAMLVVAGGAPQHPSRVDDRVAAARTPIPTPMGLPPAPMPPPDRREPVGPPAVEPMQVVIPVGQSTDGWWGRNDVPHEVVSSRHSRPTDRDQRAGARAAPDLAGYLDSARIVQCPRCGDFRLDVTHTNGGFTFRCQADGHRWDWRPGEPWPATIKVSQRRSASRRNEPAHYNRD